MRGIAVAAVVFSSALALGACGDDDSDTASDSSASTTAMAEMKDMTTGGSDKTAIVIKDFKFDPEKLTAKVGDKITVTNNDSATHTLTAKDKSVDTGELVEGANGTITLAKAGTIDYVCNIHDYMTGTIEVQ